ncbi:TIGR03013 family XrtA/PEP-CTERM system glycosyltransferase [Thalassotalea agarivorans]|uniref:Sugar transferase, PEP-CTERM system associated/exopolysaccharide biosynthesis polyprenyl glycosylphosphotransferase n=1 Tax=Thalassotalea agarivorans TaxID=349064 RepID=A0A1I0DXH1_THASX|nr:TIGR03013 family XrtA/PEP-CTERM system glycosyltransferase [Thalassotalea agarivorans]SET37225.1 sugar transferase, PEP-CTERM system associated/exopolysaccharide biosynthesis polyprenyl glycosylphosphotransferase [Thalassotalea agarivorans]
MQEKKFKDLSTASRSLLLVEFFILIGALALALFLNDQFNFVDQKQLLLSQLFVHALIFGFCHLLTALSLGLYNSKIRDNFVRLVQREVISFAIGFSILFSFALLFSWYQIAIELIALASFLAFLGILVLRYIAQKTALFGFQKRRVVVLGAGERASIIEKRMRRKVDRQGFSLLGFVPMEGDMDGGIVNEHKLSSDLSIVHYALENEINEIVIASDERRNNLPIEELFACKVRGIEITDILDFIERETGQIAVNLIYPSWVIYSSGFASPNYLRNALDWVFNASMAFVLLLFTWPFMLLTVLAIKLEEGPSASVFYHQVRVGLNGKLFKIVKFRSMREDAEKDGVKWAKTDDDRTTKVGAFIRKYRVDELPQIYNVMRGDMGFVGPRPERPEFVETLVDEIPYYNERHNVKPGLTGWAQLKYPYGATTEDAMEKLKFDLYYIKHRSFTLDLLILIRTAEVVVFGKGR